jgi:hypothetical protein
VINGPSESRRRVSRSAIVKERGAESSEEDDAVPHKRRVPNARASIMAFLDDQSDDD